MKKIILILLIIGLGYYYYGFSNGNINNYVENGNIVKEKIFTSSFESIDDFKGFYITPEVHKGTTFHELNTINVRTGDYSHKAWIKGTNEKSTKFVNNNHRAYPTIQLYKKEEGSFQTPLYSTFWVWVDMELKSNNGNGDDDWLSLATFTDDESDRWRRTLLVNLSYDGYIHLMHTSKQGSSDYIFQTSDIKFPQKEWVEIKTYLDFSGEQPYAKVWQNGVLVSHANIGNMTNKLAQAHFGMYAPPYISSGIVYNDDIEIKTVQGE